MTYRIIAFVVSIFAIFTPTEGRVTAMKWIGWGIAIIVLSVLFDKEEKKRYSKQDPINSE